MSEDYFEARDTPSPDPAARLRQHVQDRLNLIEKNGHCPVCNTTKWALLNASDAGLQHFAWPTYTLACGTCGFVRHHLRSILDGADALPSFGEPRSGVSDGAMGGSGTPLLETRVAVLEKIVSSTDDLLAELRWDVKAIRGKLEDDYRSLSDKMSEHFDKLSQRASGMAIWLYVAGGLAFAGAVVVMAKGFRWF